MEDRPRWGGEAIGRPTERALLADVVARAQHGEPSIVTLVGEPGIGKTTLADDAARLARRRGLTVVRGAADEADRSTLSLWQGPMVALGVDRGDLALVGDDRRWEVLGTIADALEAAAPILVVLDDLHWADERSLWVVDRLGGGLAGGVAVVATTRPVDLGPRRSPPGRVVPVDGLSVDEVAELSAARGSPVADAAQLRQRTGGNPLFVLELLAAPADGGVPDVIGHTLGRVLDRLPAPARRSLGTLALAGATAPAAVVAAAVAVSASELRAHFDEGLAVGVLSAPTVATVQFRHALFAEALSATMAPADRRMLQAALADAWRASGAAGAEARAAGHALLAVPHVDGATAVTAALAAGRAVAASDPSLALQLLADANDIAEQYLPSEVRLRAELLIELGLGRAAVADWTAAVDRFERAAALTATLGDPELHARAEALAASRMQMFEDDPVRRARLERALAALPHGDNPLRVELLGRLSVSQLGRGDLWPTARRHANEALETARRLADPELVALALTDRYLAAMDGTDLEARAEAAEELIDLGEAAHRPDRVLIGLEWRYGAMLSRGRVDAAKDVLDEAEVLAALMPSPEWTYGVLLRRALLAAIDGDRDRALALDVQARPLGDRVLRDHESLGLDVAVRTLVSRITGVADPALVALNAEFEATASVPAIAFFDLHSAAAALACGDTETARRLVRRVAAGLCRDGPVAEAPSTVLLAADLVAELGERALAEELRLRCEQMRGYLTTEAGFAVDQPSDLTLAKLALLVGDHLDALGLADAAVAFARSMPSPSYEARALWYRARARRALDDPGAHDDLRHAEAIADRHGLVLPADPDDARRAAPARAHPGRAALVRTGVTWLVRGPSGEGVLAHSSGVDQLAVVLAAAPREVLSVDLVAAPGTVVAPSLGPALDTAAKQSYRRRVAELRAEVDEADAHHDLERATRARLELEALMRELRRAVGLGGRDRPTGSTAERARVNVARSLRRAISTVRAAVPELGAHLEVAIRTGRACCYAPDPAARLEWEVRRG